MWSEKRTPPLPLTVWLSQGFPCFRQESGSSCLQWWDGSKCHVLRSEERGTPAGEPAGWAIPSWARRHAQRRWLGGKEALPVPHPSLQRKNKWQHVCLQEETRRERMAVNLLLWGVQKRGDVNKAPIKPFRQEGNMCPADWNACFLEKKWGP